MRLVAALVVALAPALVRAEFYCSTESNRIVGVAGDGRFIEYSANFDTPADCNTERVAIRDANGKVAVEFKKDPVLGCQRWHVTGEYALASGDHTLSAQQLAEKIGRGLGAMALVPSQRRDLFAAHIVNGINAKTDEAEATLYIRWDGEPLTSVVVANVEVLADRLEVLEHPAQKGLFLRFSSTTGGRHCGAVGFDRYVSTADFAKHAERLARRDQAGKAPLVLTTELRRGIEDGDRDPLSAARLRRTEIAARARKAKPDHCEVHTRRPLGVTKSGGLVWSQSAPSAICPALRNEAVVVEDGVVVERRPAAGCAAAMWSVSGPHAPTDAPPPQTELAAVIAWVAERAPFVPLEAQAGAALAIDTNRNGVTLREGVTRVARVKWSTTSPAASYRVERLGLAGQDRHVLYFSSSAPWRWASPAVCEDDVEDFVSVSQAETKKRVAISEVEHADRADDMADAVIANLDVKEAREAFLRRVDKHDVDPCHLEKIYRAARKRRDLRAFAKTLCRVGREQACGELEALCPAE